MLRRPALILPALLAAVAASPAGGQSDLESRRLPAVATELTIGTAAAPLGAPNSVAAPGEELPLIGPPSEGVILQDPAGWWSPHGWIRPVEWEASAELGLNGTAGNSESLSLRAGAELKRSTELHEIAADLIYARTNSDGIETQNYGILNAGYERFLAASRWTYFAKSQLTYDEFKAFDLRLALNAGLGYQLIRTDAMAWKARLGGGVSHEFGGPDNSWVPEALLGTDFSWEMSDRQKLTSKIDYFPAWDDFGDYRLDSEVAWEILLDEAHNLNLKLSLIDQYDSTPHGLKRNDLSYALLLLWKL